jgi:hypothetical protein
MKRYLGDGVSAECDGYAIVLTTETGIAVTNRIVLEPDVLEALVQFMEASGEATGRRDAIHLPGGE